MSRKITISVAVILLLFLWLTELHSVLYKIAPKEMNRMVNDFIQPGYNRNDVSMEWHIKTYFDNFIVIVAMFVASFYINIINYRLGLIFKILGMYYVVDLFLFQWNYKSFPEAYYSLILITTIVIVLLFVPLKKEKTYAKIIEFLNKEKT
jgi:hypothetical protein